MIRIEPSIVKSKIFGLSKEQTTSITAILSVLNPNRFFMPKFRNKIWDGKERFYSFEGSILVVWTGLVFIIKNFLNQNRIDYSEPFEAAPEDQLIENLKGITYRPHQIEAIQRMIKQGRGILQAPTGSGKTEIALGYLNHVLKIIGGSGLIITHRRSLYEGKGSIDERIAQRFDIVDRIRYDGLTGYKLSNGIKLFLTMGQTFVNDIALGMEGDSFLKILNSVTVSFSDEVHAVETYARKFKKSKINILNALTKCYHRWGMSATPVKDELLEQFHTLKHFGEIINIKYDSGLPVTIHMKTIKYLTKAEEYEDAIEYLHQKEDRIQSIKNALSAFGNRKTIIFVDKIEYGIRLCRILKVPFIYGESKKKERDEVIQNFIDGKISTFISSKILNFGVDIPVVDMIILAEIYKSKINVLQSIGRGTRLSEGKEDLIVIDFFDDDSGYLKKHSKQRLEYYKNFPNATINLYKQ
uniref:Putative helicase n=1 Tax=viral metagenome TaxID=1070528 RepID=A0A6M3J187_9ZZZZ